MNVRQIAEFFDRACLAMSHDNRALWELGHWGRIYFTERGWELLLWPLASRVGEMSAASLLEVEDFYSPEFDKDEEFDLLYSDGTFELSGLFSWASQNALPAPQIVYHGGHGEFSVTFPVPEGVSRHITIRLHPHDDDDGSWEEAIELSYGLSLNMPEATVAERHASEQRTTTPPPAPRGSGIVIEPVWRGERVRIIDI